MSDNTVGFIIYPELFNSDSLYISRDLLKLRPETISVRVFMTSQVHDETRKYEFNVRSIVTEMAMMRGVDLLNEYGWVDVTMALVKAKGRTFGTNIFNKEFLKEIEMKAEQFALGREFVLGATLQAAYNNPMPYNDFMKTYMERVIDMGRKVET